ncbi:MAG: hypothetical protein JRN59_07800 [Nitrososphaerota archaeon]|nr:hypothetical protein [Nitrososphaerota archaeon]
MFHEAKMGLKAYPPPDRRFGDRKLRRFKAVLSKRYRDAEVERFPSKLKGAPGDLFTLTYHPGIQAHEQPCGEGAEGTHRSSEERRAAQE